MNDLSGLESLSYSLPTPAYLFGLIFFGIAGYAAYRYGKKMSLSRFKWTGVVMMLYPYAISVTWMLYAVGIGLCLVLYVYRR